MLTHLAKRELCLWGLWKPRQISKIDGCRLRRIGELDFDHGFGGCANVNDEKILLCFSFFDGDKCRSSKSLTGIFEAITRSNYKHVYTKTDSIKSKIYLVRNSK